MGSRIIPYSKNREAIYDLLTRAKRFHSAMSFAYEIDATELLAAIKRERRAGGTAGLTACLVRATALVLEKFPRLNHHMFHGLFRKFEVEFDGIHCNLVVGRKGPDGEDMLFPVIVRDANRLSLAEVHKYVEHHRTAPLDSLPQMAAIRRLERLPRVLLKLASFKMRSDPGFYERYFGTYGLSSFVTRGTGAVGGAGVVNTCAAFFPGSLTDRPCVVRGKIEVRTILHMLLIADHFLVDGIDALKALEHLKDLLERPERLGLPPAPAREARGTAAGAG